MFSTFKIVYTFVHCTTCVCLFTEAMQLLVLGLLSLTKKWTLFSRNN